MLNTYNIYLDTDTVTYTKIYLNTDIDTHINMYIGTDIKYFESIFRYILDTLKLILL